MCDLFQGLFHSQLRPADTSTQHPSACLDYGRDDPDGYGTLQHRPLTVRKVLYRSSIPPVAVSIFQRVEISVALLSNRLALAGKKHFFQCKHELTSYVAHL